MEDSRTLGFSDVLRLTDPRAGAAGGCALTQLALKIDLSAGRNAV